MSSAESCTNEILILFFSVALIVQSVVSISYQNSWPHKRSKNCTIQMPGNTINK
jgi:hypothetical protein